MKILVINAGSSSLKYQLIDMKDESVIAKGLCERISIDGSVLTHKANGKEYVFKKDMPNHTVAIKMVLWIKILENRIKKKYRSKWDNVSIKIGKL